jgi:hypothetical protein
VTTKIPELELLRAKTLHLELLNETLKAQLLQQQIMVHEERKKTLLVKIQELRDRMAKEYDIDLDTHMVMQDTGEVVPKDSLPDIKKMMEQLAVHAPAGFTPPGATS